VRDAGPSVILIEAAGYDELMALYAACDIYLSLHRSEGFGLNLAEAMLAERAVVATGWSGNLDFMDADASALIPARLVPVRDPQRVYTVAGAKWAEPAHDAAVEALRRLRADPELRAEMAKRGAEKARTLLGGGAAAKALRTP
jgi:glycosyltransferase involved in cell wall biosynthesis